MILVTAAGGRVGRAVCAALANRGETCRALVRDPARAAQAGLDPALCVAGDLDRPATLAAALDGVQALFLAGPDSADLAAREAAVIDAAAAAGVSRVVKLSAFAAGLEPPVSFGLGHAGAEAHLAASGLQWTVLRPYMFMQTLLEFARPVAGGNLPMPLGRGRIALVDVRDVAAVAAACLVDTRSTGQALVLTGPEALSGAAMAATLAEAMQRPVRYRAAPAWLAGLLMRAEGTPPWERRMRLALFAMLAADGEAPVNDNVARMSGRPPRSLADFAREQAAAFAAGGRARG